MNQHFLLGIVAVVCVIMAITWLARRGRSARVLSFKDRFESKPTPIQNAVRLFAAPSEQLAALLPDRPVNDNQIISFAFGHILGKESDFNTIKNGAYHLSDHTRAYLRNLCIFRRNSDGWVVITDRRLNDESAYDFLGAPPPFFYALGLQQVLKRDPAKLTDWMVDDIFEDAVRNVPLPSGSDDLL